MSGLQKEAIQMISTLSAYFPLDFNPKEEYMEAMEEKYGNIG